MKVALGRGLFYAGARRGGLFVFDLQEVDWH
jgi:hypothetical protein